MFPLPHLLTGAVLGQAAGSPLAAAALGLLSHYVLDALPHTDHRPEPGERAGPWRERLRRAPDLEGSAGDRVRALLADRRLYRAGIEAAAGAALVVLVAAACPGPQILLMAVGAAVALLPDLVDQPVGRIFGTTVLHIEALHWRLPPERAVWGNLLQIAVSAAAVFGLLRLAGCW